MSRRSDLSTIKYYDDHADEYVTSTVGLDMESLYQPFLQLLPQGGSILDAGCGSGRDSKAFIDRGYQVTAIDASIRMVESTTRLTVQPAKQLKLQDLDSIEEFDGIWASASLLHVPLDGLHDVLSRFAAALRSDGSCYISFKEGEGERHHGDRLFTDFTEEGLRAELQQQALFEIIRTWVTADLRTDQSDSWVNALLNKL